MAPSTGQNTEAQGGVPAQQGALCSSRAQVFCVLAGRPCLGCDGGRQSMLGGSRNPGRLGLSFPICDMVPESPL